jgi:hypothetical protein
MDTFDHQDKIFSLLSNDDELLLLLGAISGDNDSLNKKIKREFEDMSLLKDDVPFVCIVFTDGRQTNNYLVTKGLLEVEVYAPNRYTADLICKKVSMILRENEYDTILPFRQIASGIPGVIAYGGRYLPLVF